MMSKEIEITLNNRKLLIRLMEHLSLEQLNKIPDGFSNNIIWNIGHVWVVQQMITYKLSGLEMHIPDSWIPLFKRGSKPERFFLQEEVDAIRNQLVEVVVQTQNDYELGIFKNYHEFTSELGFTMKDIQDAIAFNNFHEGVHLGIIMQLRKFVV